MVKKHLNIIITIFKKENYLVGRGELVAVACADTGAGRCAASWLRCNALRCAARCADCLRCNTLRASWLHSRGASGTMLFSYA